MRRTLVLIVLGAVGVPAVLVLLAGWCGQAQAVDVTTARVTSGRITRPVRVTGRLEPVTTVDIGTQVSGTIQSIDVDFNSIVQAGQPVARLDPSIYQARLEQAKAERARAEAQAGAFEAALEEAQSTLQRARQLMAQDAIPREELEAALIAVRAAALNVKASQAGIQVAEAAVREAEVDLGQTVIRSPIDGIVVHRHVNVGQTVAATVESPVLLTVADLRRMHLLAEIGEADVAEAQAGRSVTFQVDAVGEEVFEGTIADLRLHPLAEQAGSVATSGTVGSDTAATATLAGSDASGSGSAPPTSPASPAAGGGASGGSDASGVVTYVAIIEVNNAEGRFLPGGTATVTLTSGSREEVTRIPRAALTFAPGEGVLDAVGQDDPELDRPGADESPTRDDGPGRKGRVWRYEEERFVPIDVEVGTSDDEWTELLDGPIQAGDELVVAAVVLGRARP